MSARLDETLVLILEEVDTAPEGQILDDALDDVLDFVQNHRAAIVAGLAPPPVTIEAPRYMDTESGVLRAFLAHLVSSEGVNYVPAAVSRRGMAYIPTPVPAGMTERMFEMLLEAEAQCAEDLGEETGAAVLRQDLKRRRDAFAAQDRRAEQLAALAPIKGRVPLSRAGGL